MNPNLPSREQGIEILKARTKAFRWPKGESGNPDGQSRFYHEARKIAREASPEIMRELVNLAKTAEDERVRSVCAVAVLDRAGVKPIDYDPNEDKAESKFDPRNYSDDELALIERVLRMMREPRAAPPAAKSEDGEPRAMPRSERWTAAPPAETGDQPTPLARRIV